MSEVDKKIIYNILTYIQSLKSGSNSDDIDTALTLLESSFDISLTANNDYKEYSLYPNTVDNLINLGIEQSHALTYNESIKSVENNSKFQEFIEVVSSKGFFDGASPDSIEYYQRYVKVIQKFNARVNSSNSNEISKAEKEKLAEEKKILGNTAFSAKDYHTAIQHYTEALDYSNNGPNSHIYYCNRAAAYSYLNEHAEAVADCEAAIELVPDYVKVYSRLGLSSFYLGDYEKSVRAYEKAVELEPDNEASKKGLKQAKKKLDEKRKVSTTSAPSSMPDVSSMLNDPNIANNPFMKDALGKVGGQEGLANLMKDPAMMAMAQKMMQDPAALQQAMSMLGGAKGGGMPDMSSLAGMMGGLGGNAGKGKKGGFKGFEDDA